MRIVKSSSNVDGQSEVVEIEKKTKNEKTDEYNMKTSESVSQICL